MRYDEILPRVLGVVLPISRFYKEYDGNVARFGELVQSIMPWYIEISSTKPCVRLAFRMHSTTIYSQSLAADSLTLVQCFI
jgi:hypothetical protein